MHPKDLKLEVQVPNRNIACTVHIKRKSKQIVSVVIYRYAYAAGAFVYTHACIPMCVTRNSPNRSFEAVYLCVTCWNIYFMSS